MNKEYLIDCLSKGMSTRDIEKECQTVSYGTVCYWIKKYGLQNKSAFSKLEKYSFNKIDSPEKAYVLGFILADGSINQNKIVDLSTSIQDKEVVDYIASIINARVKCDYTINKKTRRFPRARLTKKIPDILKYVGGYKKPERHYPRVNPLYEKYLLLGLFDADGCITWGYRKDKNVIWQKVSFTSQYKILEGVQKYLYKKIGISSSIHPKSGCNCYVLEFSDKLSVLKFCEHIYEDQSFIVLHRKYNKYNALRLELEENGETNCIDCQSRAKPTEWEGVETNGVVAI